MKSPILCLYGPPGVGKHPWGNRCRSLGQEYVRMSLGGSATKQRYVVTENLHWGHAGRIVQPYQKKSGTSNPVLYWMK